MRLIGEAFSNQGNASSNIQHNKFRLNKVFVYRKPDSRRKYREKGF